MKKSVLQSIEKLKHDDLIVLNYLYLYRAMDVDQIMTHIYHVDYEKTAGKRARTIITKRLMAEGVVTLSKYYPGQDAMQITNKGIEIVRYTRDIPNQVFDSDTKTIERGYYTAADLNLNTRFINHQVHLNQFMIDFEKKAQRYNIPWKYYDEKFLSRYVGMRPDGLITILDTDFFIEIDMATESKDQLKEKWEHYREFMRTDEFRHKSRKIIVLFDIDNLKSHIKIKNRINLVKSTLIDGLLDEINGDFEIVIKPKDELIDYIFNSYISEMLQKNTERNNILQYFKKNGYQLSYGYGLNKTLQGDFYNFYLRKRDEQGKLVQSNGIVDEYFLDFYEDEEISVLHRIEWYDKNSTLYKEQFKRSIRLIVVTKNIEQTYKDFELVGQKILGQPGIFLLDVNKIDTYIPVYKNLYQLGITGEVYNITTPDLSRRKFVYKINSHKNIKHKRGKI